MYNNINEIQQDVIEILEGYGFQTSIKPFSSLNGYLKMLDNNYLYVFAKCSKFIDDDFDEENIDNRKKKVLIVRFSIYVGEHNHNKGKKEISFDYTLGGNSGSETTCKEKTKEIIMSCFTSHNLYTNEELKKLEKSNKTYNLFDFLETE